MIATEQPAGNQEHRFRPHSLRGVLSLPPVSSFFGASPPSCQPRPVRGLDAEGDRSMKKQRRRNLTPGIQEDIPDVIWQIVNHEDTQP